MKSYTRLALFLLILLLSVGMLSTAINILGDITELDLEEDVPGAGESTLGPGGLTKGGGEAIPVYEKGGRFFSLVGGNDLFHSPEDRWPEAVDMDKITRITEGLIEFSLQLAK